jgi:hypothetical protein
MRSDSLGLGPVVNPVGHVPSGPSPQGKTMCQWEVAIPLLHFLRSAGYILDPF